MAELAVQDSRATVIALEGELGAGKTTFVQAMARVLGVAERVVSPTFILMRAYAIAHGQFHTLVHIDAYRIDDASEFAALRFDELCADAGNLICIEWASRLGDMLPSDAYHIALSHTAGEPGRAAAYGYAARAT